MNFAHAIKRLRLCSTLGVVVATASP